MEALEFIRVRTYSVDEKKSVVDMVTHLPDDDQKGPEKIWFLENKAIPTDIIVCLLWVHETLSAGKSDFGEKLAAALKYFGWISHSVWKPLQERMS